MLSNIETLSYDYKVAQFSEGLSAGYDEGFFIKSEEYDSLFITNILSQNRFIFDYRNGPVSLPATNNTFGFENAIDALNFSGYLFTRVYYDFRLLMGAYSRQPRIQWAYAGWFMDNGFSVSLGVFPMASSREWIINNEFQLLATQAWTLANLYLTATALQFGYTSDYWRISGYFGNGLSGKLFDEDLIGITLDPKPYRDNNNSYSLSSRLEVILYTDNCYENASDIYAGPGPDVVGQFNNENFGKFNQFTRPKGYGNDVLLGLWASYIKTKINNEENNEVAISGTQLQFSMDVQASLSGANFYGIIWLIPNKVSVKDEELDLCGTSGLSGGFAFHGGFYAKEKLELFGRYEFAKYNPSSLTSLVTPPDTLASLFSLGFNYYLATQSCKITSEFGYSFYPLNNPTNFLPTASTAWLNDAANQGNQWRFILQLQLFL